jgi:hypothetical protein
MRVRFGPPLVTVLVGLALLAAGWIWGASASAADANIGAGLVILAGLVVAGVGAAWTVLLALIAAARG